MFQKSKEINQILSEQSIANSNIKKKDIFSARLDIIKSICFEEYSDICAEIEKIYRDTEDLYNGKWPEYNGCDTGYHNFEHASEVTLAAVRMIAGWNRVNKENKIPYEYFKIAFIASMFHDAGYIREISDNSGTGAKYTFSHVPRSIQIALFYLNKIKLNDKLKEFLPLIIGITEFNSQISFDQISQNDNNLLVITKIVGTADLIAQVADVFYLERLPALFAEFQESYDFEGREKLRGREIRIFETVEEILSETLVFVENFVLPRFELFGRMDKFLSVFFKTDRNPYLESISANLYRSVLHDQIKWQKIGDIFKELNIVDENRLKDAVFIQSALRDDYKILQNNLQKKNMSFSPDNLFSVIKWMDSNSGYYNIGEILTKMGAIKPEELRKAIMQQLLPSNLIDFIRHDDMEFLLNVSILLLNLRRIPQILTHLMEMVCQNIPCEASSILLADHDSHDLIMSVVTGPKEQQVKGLRLPWDKGVAGWVYNHGQWAVVNKALWDNRFYNKFDELSGFCTNSVMAIPLMIDGQIVGIIELLNKDNGNGIFNERDLAVLHYVSIQIAGSIDTALWLYQNKLVI
jgi:hypothetical protein